MRIEVRGNGSLANEFALVLDGISAEYSVDEKFSNHDCLPDPSPTASHVYWKLAGCIVGIVLLTFLEALFLRLRHPICAMFYPRREKARTLHLYNGTLKKRKIFLKQRQQILHKRLAKARQAFGAKIGPRWLYNEESKRFATRTSFASRLFKVCARKTARKLTCNLCETASDVLNHCRNCSGQFCYQCWTFMQKGAHCVCQPPKSRLDAYGSKIQSGVSEILSGIEREPNKAAKATKAKN